MNDTGRDPTGGRHAERRPEEYRERGVNLRPDEIEDFRDLLPAMRDIVDSRKRCRGVHDNAMAAAGAAAAVALICCVVTWLWTHGFFAGGTGH